MKEIIKNNKKLFYVLVGVVLITVIGFSYAMFFAVVEGNDNAKEVITSTGNLSLEYTDGPEIKEQNIYPS